MKEEGGDPEAVTGRWLTNSVQGDCFCISATSSGTMEGKEPSPSHHCEESSTLNLPSVCDLAEHFLPPHCSGNSEEQFCSVDTFPSLPTDVKPLRGTGAETQIHCRSVLPYEGAEPSGMVSEKMKEIKEVDCQGESNLPSAVPASFSVGGSERANVRCYPKAGLCEPTEPNDAAFPRMYEQDSAEDTGVRKSLDDFYKMYCTKRPDRVDPTHEAASRCLSQKISELANQDGTKYALRCLQMAQMVLNRDGCKIFPNHPTTACFAKPDEGEVVLEDRKKTPGLSDDVLQFLLRQTQTERSPAVSHEK